MRTTYTYNSEGSDIRTLKQKVRTLEDWLDIHPFAVFTCPVSQLKETIKP